MNFKIVWVDGGRKARNPPDPEFPNGMAVDIAPDGARSCTALLPYPAPRCGHHQVECTVCKFKLIVTAAGRPDDPRSVRVPCKETRH